MYRSIRGVFWPPVYLFQMGKVGSTSLQLTLSKKYKGEVIYAHNHKTMSHRGKQLLKWYKHLHLPFYVICPVRDPLSRNVSAFFQNFKRDTGYDFSEHEWTAMELRELFLQNYLHNVCLEWFDSDFRPTFDIDVFARPFPTDQKWDIYKKGSLKVLVYRSDMDHSEQLNVISRLIGCKIDGWSYSNRSEDKEYKSAYKSFCSLVTLPDIYISIMCKSRFCQHFWSEEEIASFSKKWKG